MKRSRPQTITASGNTFTYTITLIHWHTLINLSDKELSLVPNPPGFSAFLGLLACSLFPNSMSPPCNKQPHKKKYKKKQKTKETQNMCVQQVQEEAVEK